MNGKELVTIADLYSSLALNPVKCAFQLQAVLAECEPTLERMQVQLAEAFLDHSLFKILAHMPYPLLLPITKDLYRAKHPS